MNPRVLILLCLLALPSPAQDSLIGRWVMRDTSESHQGREIAIELQADGQASIKTALLKIGFVETSDGECVAHTFREDEHQATGTYATEPGRLSFGWKGARLPEGYFQQQGHKHVWPYRLEDGTLVVTLPGRQLRFQRQTL